MTMSTDTGNRPLYVANRETGSFICQVGSYEEGLQLISTFLSEDREEGFYEPDFYDIVNESHEHVEPG